MPTPVVLELAALILVVALLYSMVGHAGASGYLAAMALLGVSHEVMKPTALVLNVIVATITSAQYALGGHFRWRLLWPFVVASMPMAFVGGRVALAGQYYKPLVGLVLLFSAWRLVAAGPRAPEGEPRVPRIAVAMGVGAGLGLLAGLTGTGGGIFLSPVIMLCGWADAKKTGGVSSVFILANSVAGIVGLISSGQALPAAAPVWGAAAVVGGVVGSYLGARRLKSTTLRRVLAVVLVIAGLKLVGE